MSEPVKSIWTRHHALPPIVTVRILRKILFCAACLATFTALFYAEEDLRGKHAWENCMRAARAKGIELDWRAYIPGAVLDDENFAATPLFAKLFDYEWTTTNVHWRDTNIWASVDRLSFHPAPAALHRSSGAILTPPSPIVNLGDWVHGRSLNLKQWQEYFRSPESFKTNYWPVPVQPRDPSHDVLFALNKLATNLAELQEAALRPQSRFPVHYDELSKALLVHLNYLVNISRVLQLRAVAELSAESNQLAFADTMLAFHCADALESEAFMVSQVVRCRMIEGDLQSVWEGLSAHRWSEKQIVEFQRYFVRQDFLSRYDQAVKADIAFTCGCVAALSDDPSVLRMMDNWPNSNNTSFPGGGLEAALDAHLLPRGWLYQNEVSAARFLRETWSNDVASRIQRVYPDLSAANAGLFHRLPEGPYDFAFKHLGGSISPQEFVRTQTEINLALVACALERFRMTHGDFPQSLDALAQEFLERIPHDIVNGEPLKYRWTRSGSFTLYSVGWDEKDDGGIFPVSLPATSGGFRSLYGYHPENGDFVWQYPEAK